MAREEHFRSCWRTGTVLRWSVGIVIAAVATACGSDRVDQPEVSALSTASFETCTGFLDLEDVRNAAGRSDIEIGDPNINSGTQELNASGIETLCVIEYITPEILIGGPTQLRVSGPSMTLTAIAFDSGLSAVTHYRLVLEGVRLTGDNASPRSDVAEGVLGKGSYLLIAEAEGISSIIGFQVGPYVLQLHTTLPDGQAPLVVPDKLVALAGTVRAHFVSAQ